MKEICHCEPVAGGFALIFYGGISIIFYVLRLSVKKQSFGQLLWLCGRQHGRYREGL